mmetsp:Transcript_24927/g.58486  ORF Transcript_24927/g.58486 Transcript_24927/m.58486 type:complete len:443 (-) Transcript_24927:59-1387(-)
MTSATTRTKFFPVVLAAALVRWTVVDAWAPPPIAPPAVVVASSTQNAREEASTAKLSDHVRGWVARESRSASEWIGVPPAFAADDVATTTTGPPTKEEILTLQKAFAAFYGTQRDPQTALQLLDESIRNFERQPPDERAGLYRVRGDCKMALKNPVEAVEDYASAIDLLLLPESKNKADPAELPASTLGRARAIRSLGSKASSQQVETAAKDYKEVLVLSSREDWDTIEEKVEDGAKTNPYAAWEYGMALRRNGQYEEAKAIHSLTSDLFDSISDRPRAVISLLDAGIDAACAEASSGIDSGAKALLRKGVGYTTTAESRDVALLQRVVAKEGEARVVLAAMEWTDPNDKSLRNDAEKDLSTACERLDQLEQDAMERGKKKVVKDPSKLVSQVPKLRFNIDDYPGALETSCARLTKNKEFQQERLELPEIIQEKIQKLNQLK